MKAEMLAPNSAEPYNALGTLKASEGKRTEAEQLYRQALQKNPSLLPARHNLALLLADQKGREKEAIDLWRENLQQSPDYLPSRLSLAGALAAQGDNAAAAEEYRKVLEAKPDYVAARIALADVLGEDQRSRRRARSAAPGDQAGFAGSGAIRTHREIWKRRGTTAAEARTAYQSALDLKPERTLRKRIENKHEKRGGKLREAPAFQRNASGSPQAVTCSSSLRVRPQ